MSDAEAVVRELLARVAAERGLRGPPALRPITSGGSNFTSALFLATLDHLHLFSKVAIVGDKMRVVMNAERLYKVEQIVYNELAQIYGQLIEKRENARPFRFPETFAMLEEVGIEAVVMEDMSAQGYKTPSRIESADWRFASAAVSKLATFHSLSFAFEKERPDEFKAMAERLKYEFRQYGPEEEESVNAAMKKMVEGALQPIKDEHKERLLKLLQNPELFLKFREPIVRTVLVHGDYRTSNLMLKEKDGSPDIVVVDYQTVHSGCATSDLLYFLFLGTDHHFRRNHYQDILQHYYDELGAALNGLGLNIEEEYPKEHFEREIKEMLPLTLLMAVVVLPVVTVEEGAAPQVSGEADLRDFAVTPNQLFAERFRELVEDCVTWGAI